MLYNYSTSFYHVRKMSTSLEINKLIKQKVTVFVYELSGCGFESRVCYLNFRYGARLIRARSSLTFRQTLDCRFTLKLERDMIITHSN